MSVFKLRKNSHRKHEDRQDEIGELVVSLIRDQNNFIYVTENLAVGVLRPRWAVLRLEVAKEEDCSVDYVCLVRSTDNQGREVVVNVSLSGSSGQGDVWSRNPKMTSEVVLQMLSLLQKQVDLGASLGDKLESLDRTLNYRLDKLETQMNDKAVKFANTVAQIYENTKTLDGQFEEQGENSHEMRSLHRMIKEMGARRDERTLSEKVGKRYTITYREPTNSGRHRYIARMLADLLKDTDDLGDQIKDDTAFLEEKIRDLGRLVVDRTKDLEEKIDRLNKPTTRKSETLERMFEGLLDYLNETIRNRNGVENTCIVDGKDQSLPRNKNLTATKGSNFTILQGLNRIEESLEALREDMKDKNLIIGGRYQASKLTYLNLMFNYLMGVKDKIINSWANLSHRSQTKFTRLHQSCNDFKKLKANVREGCVHAIADISKVIDDTEVSMWNSLKPAESFNVGAKECRKGMQLPPNFNASSFQLIRPNSMSGLGVEYLCDIATDGGGWIVIQRRSSQDVRFYRKWRTYKNGFGHLRKNFWLGNKHIHALTSHGTYELRVDLIYGDRLAFAHYSFFSLDGEDNKYTLRLGRYNGTAGDSLSPHNGKRFSTRDRDNDGDAYHWARLQRGGWWYFPGLSSNLNGYWSTRSSSTDSAARWETFSGEEPVTFSEMKIRKI